MCVSLSYHFMFFDVACMVFDTSVVNYSEDFQSSKVDKIPDARLLLLLILPGLSVSNAQASRQKVNCSFELSPQKCFTHVESCCKAMPSLSVTRPLRWRRSACC